MMMLRVRRAASASIPARSSSSGTTRVRSWPAAFQVAETPIERRTSRMRSTSTMRATLRRVVRPRLSSAAQSRATAAFLDDFTAMLPRSGLPPATRRWVGPVGPRLISSLSSATDSRPRSSRVRFWLPCSMRATALWLVPSRSASCCWVRPRWRRASRTREPMRCMESDWGSVTGAQVISPVRSRVVRACRIGRVCRRPSSGDTPPVDVLVTGGTGRLGQRLLQPLQDAGHRVRRMSRRGAGPGGIRGDLATGGDLDTALAGAELVVHAASDPRRDPWQVDVAGTRRLVEAVDRDRLQHLVYISIVGVDRIPYGYYRAKFAAEQVLLASGLPVTLLRVTQFHDFADFLLDQARRGPVLPVPMGWRVQPVDVGEAAGHVVEVAGRPATGGVVEFGGPEDVSAADLARSWASVRAPG